MFELNQLLARNQAGNRIKFRILIPLVLALGVLLATFAFAIWRVQQKELPKAADVEAQEIEQGLHAAQNQKAAVLRTTIEAVMNDGQLTEAFRKRDRATLLKRAKPLFASLRSGQSRIAAIRGSCRAKRSRTECLRQKLSSCPNLIRDRLSPAKCVSCR